MAKKRSEGEDGEPAVLSEELADLARRELGETPESRRAALAQLRQLIEDEPLLHCPVDDDFLIMFLRVRKFNVDKAFESIKNFCHLQMDHPDVFDNLDPFTIPFDTVCREHKIYTLSRKRDPEGCPVVMGMDGAWNADICSLTEKFRVAAIIYHYMLQQEDAQIRGIVVVLNMSGFGPYHLMYYTPRYLKKLISIMQVNFYS